MSSASVTTKQAGGVTITNNSTRYKVDHGTEIDLSIAGTIQATVTSSGLSLPAHALPVGSGGTGFTNPGSQGNLVQSNGSGGLIVHGGPLGTGAIAIGGGDGYWDSSPLPSLASTVLYWDGSGLVWTTIGSATIHGTWTPTLLVNPAFNSGGGTLSYFDRPNYLSGGNTANYHIQRGNWTSKAINVGGSTLYEVNVNALLVVTSYNGTTPSVTSFTISLPFANAYDDMSTLLGLQNTNGQISIPSYSMNGQSYIAGFNWNTWNPIVNTDDLWQFNMTYYTTTAPP